MPLLPPGKKNRSANIGELIKAGHPQKQAVAIEYSEERRTQGPKKPSPKKK